MTEKRNDRIHKLEKVIYDKIAAGEVVERPASIVKELVENAIDAGSSTITVEIEKGGKKLIRVVDNGSGIHGDDVAVAFERHATSKISAVDDIYRIATLGFRGEALASISAVSHVTLTTRQADAEVGSKIEALGGRFSEVGQIGCPAGTILTVKDLFFNTPARLKFLKSDTAEQTAITELMCKLAVSHPEIAFKYYTDSRMLFSTRGDGTLLHAIAAVYGTETAKGLAHIDKTDGHGRVKGFSSKLELTRGNKSHQLLFVNGRFVRSETVSDGLKLAYGSSLPAGRHPVSFLFIEVDPAEVDVNIHPAKTEIKFHNDGAIKQLVYTAVRDGLLNTDMISRPKVVPSAPLFTRPVGAEPQSKELEPASVVVAMSRASGAKAEGATLLNDLEEARKESATASSSSTPVPSTPLSPKPVVSSPLMATRENMPPYRTEKPVDLSQVTENMGTKVELMGLVDRILQNEKIQSQETAAIERQVQEQEEARVKADEAPETAFAATLYDDLIYIGSAFRSYLLFEKGRDLYLLDQHAAHEKILYEDFLSSYQSKSLAAQVLMEPFTLTLSADDYQRCLEALPQLAALGIAAEDFGSGAVIVREVPILFGEPVSREFVKEVIEGLAAIDVQGKSHYDFKVDTIIMESCKSAIKANHRLTTLEVEALIKQLKKLKAPYTCPHGRPILVALERDKIDRMFLRT